MTVAPDATAPVAPTFESSMITQRSIVGAELDGGVKVEIGRGLAPLDMLPAAVDVRLEQRAKAEVIEMCPHPPRRAR